MLPSGVIFPMAVIGRFKDSRNFSSSQIQAWVSKCWITNEEIKVEKVGKVFFFYCTHVDDRDNLLAKRSACFQGALIIFKCRFSGASIRSFDFSTAPLWIRTSLEGRVPNSCSWSGRSIMKSVYAMAKGVGVRIGNGSSSEILGPSWTGKSRVYFKENLNGVPQKPKWVKELITENRTWDEGKLRLWFDEDVAKCIQSIHLSSSDHHDSYVWTVTTHGEYQVKSGYWELKNNNSKGEESPNFWKKLWKQKIWPKWKYFYWKLYNGALATRVNLRNRKILSEFLCPLCGKCEETDTHLFKDCEISMRIWKSSNLGIMSQIPLNQNVKIWTRNWLWFLMNSDEEKDTRVFDFIAILWSIWLLRIKCAFNTKAKSGPIDAMTGLKHWKDRWLAIHNHQNTSRDKEEKKKSESSLKEMRARCWSKNWENTRNHSTIIIDGAWKTVQTPEKSETKAAYGWAIIEGNVQQEWGSGHIYVDSPLQAETYALLFGCKGVIEKKCANIEIWTDSEELVRSCSNIRRAKSSIKPILEDVMVLLKSCASVKILNVPRVKVACAHSLAVEARKGCE